MGAVGWHNGLSIHGFRQTQTAITSYYLARGGPFLRYETPIFGIPWSVPFEFPLYQWIVAVVSSTFRVALETAGRAVSEVFFWLSLLTMWGILAELRVRRAFRLVFITLTAVSPLYIYISRTFMIESTALFFCTAYLFFLVRYIRTRQLTDACLGSACGIAGALVKLTTFPGFALVGGMLYAWSVHCQIGTLRDQPSAIKAYAPVVIAVISFVCLPILITALWVQYTDDLRSLNLVSQPYLTTAALHQWNFGTVQQRFLAGTWITMFSRIIPDLSGNPTVLIIPCAAILFARSRLIPFLISIAGFLSTFLVFTNLHVVHDYYAYANGVFLIAAFSWCIVGLLEGKAWRRAIGIAIFLICIVNSGRYYYGRFYPAQQNTGRSYANLASAVKDSTAPSDVILIFQNDWSSELAYSSERRALIWPAWMDQRADAAPMREAFARLGDNKIGAVLFCDQARTNNWFVRRSVSSLGLAPTPVFRDASCSVFLMVSPTLGRSLSVSVSHSSGMPAQTARPAAINAM